MVIAGNILAAVLMLVMPFVRPCWCGEFTLFCECSVREDVPKSAPSSSPVMVDHCSAGHMVASDADQDLPAQHETKTPPDPVPQEGKPCMVGMMLPIVVMTPAMDIAAQIMTDAAPAFLVIHQLYVPQVSDESPVENQPPPVCLLVVRTQFLRI